MSHQRTNDLVRDLASDDDILEESKLSIDESFFERELKRKEVESKDETLKDRRQDRQQRKSFSTRIFAFMCLYMMLALVVVFCCGFGWMCLSDAVLIALLTTTLANVIGVFNFVAKYLFHK